LIHVGDEQRRYIMAVLYKNESFRGESVKVSSLARALEADEVSVEDDLHYLEGVGFVKLKDGTVALTEEGYRAMEGREFSFCPHL
jgi:Mn-dependent DtxR family transcriptional regulator